MQSIVEYLPHTIDAGGLHLTAEKVTAVKDIPEPNNVRDLRSFLGLTRFYGKFLPNLSADLLPLHELTQKNKEWKESKSESNVLKC